MTSIPPALAEMVANRRVIPFVGAGFSSALDLPGWDGLLASVADDLQLSDADPSLDFSSIRDLAGDDFLRIAEYLFIRAGSTIGPLRLAMTKALTTDEDLTRSTPHVELLNLGAPQIYTTNFDDLLELTYRALGIPVEVVALSRDVALADATKTQIVKYHGDLRYDHTLVLTESQYIKRLDFESPMDLKFRSDLLGRSVLFMGYSFRDINIRVIWFRLMEMMREVPIADRAPSYMVRFAPNPVEEALYRAVGLETIVLDPDDEAKTSAERTALLSEFLMDLGAAAAPGGRIPGSSQPMFTSIGYIEAIQRDWIDYGYAAPRGRLSQLDRRKLTTAAEPAARALLESVAKPEASRGGYSLPIAARLVPLAAQMGPSPELTLLTVQALLSPPARRSVLDNLELPWDVVWASSVEPWVAEMVLNQAHSEAEGHRDRRFFDDDIVYATDLTVRLANGLLRVDETPVDDSARSEFADEDAEEGLDVRSRAQNALQTISEIYPAVLRYQPPADGPPTLGTMLRPEIDARAGEPAAERAVSGDGGLPD